MSKFILQAIVTIRRRKSYGALIRNIPAIKNIKKSELLYMNNLSVKSKKMLSKTLFIYFVTFACLIGNLSNGDHNDLTINDGISIVGNNDTLYVGGRGTK